LPGKTEVTYFQSVFFTDKEVFRLDVPMDDVESMKVDKSLQKLIDKSSYDRQFDAIGSFLQNF